MPGVRMSGIRELQQRLQEIAEFKDDVLANAVHDALIQTYKEKATIPESGKTFTWTSGGGKNRKPRSGPRNISKGSLKRALLNRKDNHHVWRWQKGKFRYGVKGGPLYGETKETGKKDRKPRGSRSRGPKANIARALHFQGGKISAQINSDWSLVTEAVADVMMGRKK